MIQKVEMFTIKCDNCQELFEDTYMNNCAWTDGNSAWEIASNCEWLKYDKDVHYCPFCYSYSDDSDEVVINGKRTKHD